MKVHHLSYLFNSFIFYMLEKKYLADDSLKVFNVNNAVKGL